jgi:hypothetical protein
MPLSRILSLDSPHFFWSFIYIYIYINNNNKKKEEEEEEEEEGMKHEAEQTDLVKQ